MPLPVSVHQHLVKKNVRFDLRVHPPSLRVADLLTYLADAGGPLLRAVPLVDAQGPALAVFPVTHVVDGALLYATLNRRFARMSAELAAGIFSDCEAGCVPALGDPYGVPVFVDESVRLVWGPVVIPGGSQTSHIGLAAEDFLDLQEHMACFHLARPRSEFPHLYPPAPGRATGASESA